MAYIQLEDLLVPSTQLAFPLVRWDFGVSPWMLITTRSARLPESQVGSGSEARSL